MFQSMVKNSSLLYYQPTGYESIYLFELYLFPLLSLSPYPQNVISHYITGVHWNFFFTLGGVAILISLLNIPPRYSAFFGCAILIGIIAFLSSLYPYRSFLHQLPYPNLIHLFVHSSSIYLPWIRLSVCTI